MWDSLSSKQIDGKFCVKLIQFSRDIDVLKISELPDNITNDD